VSVPVLAVPAHARVDDGEAPSHLSGWSTVLYFVVVPVGAFLFVALLTYLPSMRRRPRYRPTRAWNYGAVWFNGPDEPEKAIESVSVIQLKGGGASASW
jgi:hypothetical protein